jgi:hypothetical protein
VAGRFSLGRSRSCEMGAVAFAILCHQWGRIGASFVANFRQHFHARLQIGGRNLRDQFGAEIAGSFVNLREDARGTALEMHGFAAPIVGRGLTFDPTLALEPMEQTDERRLFHADALREIALSELALIFRKMTERTPLCLAQPQRPQTFVELVPPGARGAMEERADLLLVDGGHVR